MYDDTWDNHVVLHAEMAGKLSVVEQSLIVPTFICEGNLGDTFQFINLSPSDQALNPLVVIVGGDNYTGELVVRTAFKGRKKHTDKSQFKVRWP